MVAGHATRAGTLEFAEWAVAQRGANRGHFREFLPEEVRPLLAEHRARLKAA